MLTLFTGLPGHGKTQFALTYIKNKAEKENRQVFYHNIKELTLPWHEIKPEEWTSVPDGSIVVLDECQKVFAPKPNGSTKPVHYEELATHRHRGLDIFIITQHPMLIDNFVRLLVNQHFHSIRKYGFERATIYEWDKVCTAPQDSASQKNAVPIKWSFNKEAYHWYKSAEVHNVKKRLPMHFFIVAAFVVSLSSFGYYFLSKFDKSASSQPVASQDSSSFADKVGLSSGSKQSAKSFDPMADATNYVAMNTPRLVGLPHTAPKYDELTKPTRVPVPAACIQIGAATARKPVRCKCYTQQGTPMDVEFNMCIDFARNGWFRDFDPDPRAAAQMAQQQQQSAPPQVLPESRPSVVSFGSDQPVVPRGSPVDNSDEQPPKRRAQGAQTYREPRTAAAM